MPLGEKGVGRLAVQNQEKATQTQNLKNKNELEIVINWPKLINNAEFIDQTEVSITELTSRNTLKKQLEQE